MTLSLAVEKEKIPLKALTLEMNFSAGSIKYHFRAKYGSSTSCIPEAEMR
jgi:hypothetical protein